MQRSESLHVSISFPSVSWRTTRQYTFSLSNTLGIACQVLIGDSKSEESVRMCIIGVYYSPGSWKDRGNVIFFPIMIDGLFYVESNGLRAPCAPHKIIHQS